MNSCAVTYDGVIQDVPLFRKLWADPIWQSHYIRKTELEKIRMKIQTLENLAFADMVKRQDEFTHNSENPEGKE